MEGVIFIGIPGTGKSSLFKERFFRTHVRISLDLLNTRHRERRLLEFCVATEQPFVVDNTNPARRDRLPYISAAKDKRFKTTGYYFQSKVEDCLRRNARRPDDERVPDVAILSSAKMLERPALEEGFDQLFYVTLDDDGFVIEEWRDEVDELDEKMRVFETAADYCVLPGIYMVARLDGRSFTRLTKEVCQFEAPFDERFRDMMVATTEALMTCGFRVSYGYTESDEISLLFAVNETQFGRKLRKFTSLLAAEASAKFSLLLGQVATFDCRISQLPRVELVVDYFRWRNEDASRNALNAHCYWTLRKSGQSEREATSLLAGISVGQKNEMLFQNGINFNDVPNWQKRGVGLYWEDIEKPSRNPVTGAEVLARRRKLKLDFDLPMKSEYGEFVRVLVNEGSRDW